MFGLDLSPRQWRASGASAPAPLSDYFGSAGGQSVAIAQGVDDSLSVWSEVGPAHAAWMRLDGNDPTTRWSWRETLIAELRNIYTVADMALVGGWSKLQSSGSGLSGSYIGNRGVSTSSTTATATVAVESADTYDLWIYYTGRTNGGYCRVQIDGAQDLVNELTDPGGLGFKAFSTYTATDLQRRRSVKIASGLTGAHDVQLSNAGPASPGGNAILIEAVAISGDLSGSRILPPLWQPAKAYEAGDEVQYGGRYYAARADGTSGTAGPTHAGGIASDGALDWRVDNRPTYPKFVAVDYASEREYAARVAVAGNPIEFGGQTHGNEVLQSQSVELDGQPWVPANTGNGLSLGAQINITEMMQWRLQDGTPLADCQFHRMIKPGAVTHSVDLVGTGPAATFEWLYAGMAPFVAWDGESKTQVAARFQAGSAAPVTLATYDGTNPANLDFPDATRIGIDADLLDHALQIGVEAGPVAVSGNIVNQFDTFLRPNLNATTAGGSADWQAKAYLTGHGSDPLVFAAGDALAFFSRHVMQMKPGTND